MSERWKDCIVTLIDVIGIQSLARGKKGEASTRMRQLHKLTVAKMGDESSMKGIAHAYAWNDSVLLLAFPQAPASAANILAQISQFKECVDEQVGRSYAVCVKGQTFPDLLKPEESPRCTVLKASSYAMANCFLIEKQLKAHRADWYVDSRVSTSVVCPPFAKQEVAVMPSTKKRRILMFKGYLHGAQSVKM